VRGVRCLACKCPVRRPRCVFRGRRGVVVLSVMLFLALSSLSCIGDYYMMALMIPVRNRNPFFAGQSGGHDTERGLRSTWCEVSCEVSFERSSQARRGAMTSRAS